MTCILLLALACGKSASDHLEAARKDLDQGQFDPAIQDAEHGLQADPDDRTEWGLQLALLEAYARAGQAADTKQKLDELAAEHPDRIQPSDYSGSAQRLKDAGKGGESIEILDAGHKRFPEDATISKMIREAAEAGDPAALERLKSLGYIQ
jgi:predicted Zn-dependent protease